MEQEFENDDSIAEDAFERRETRVDTHGHGQRLDKAMVALAPEFSRSHLQDLILKGHVMVDGRAAGQPSRRVLAGQLLQVELIPTSQSLAFRPEPVALDILYEDEHLAVINKPAGLVMHPAAGNWSGTLLNGLLARYAPALHLPRAGIVHRLDKDTSGLLVVGRTLPAITALVRDIAARAVHREYLALVHGEVTQGCSIDAPVGRDPASRVRMAVVQHGKAARTDVQPMAYQPGFTALRCTLHTGRTHQIRVHLAHLGHPLVSDSVYGGAKALGLLRQGLHARRLAFAHPITGEPLDFEIGLPADMSEAWTCFRST